VSLVHALDGVVGRQRAGDDLPERLHVAGVEPEPVPVRDLSKIIIGGRRDRHGKLPVASEDRRWQPTRAPAGLPAVAGRVRPLRFARRARRPARP
jgi:hypothetical protein